MPSPEKPAEYIAWTQKHITGGEKGEAQILLDQLLALNQEVAVGPDT